MKIVNIMGDCVPFLSVKPRPSEISTDFRTCDIHELLEMYPQYKSTGGYRDIFLFDAVRYQSLHIIEYLCENGEIVTLDIFNMAAITGNLDIMKYLCTKIKDINDNGFGSRALITACKYGHLNIVNFLYENKVDIRSEDDSALRFAAANNRMDITIYLLQRGARINFTNGMLYFVKENGTYSIWHCLLRAKIELSDEIQTELQKYDEKINLTKNARR